MISPRRTAARLLAGRFGQAGPTDGVEITSSSKPLGWRCRRRLAQPRSSRIDDGLDWSNGREVSASPVRTGALGMPGVFGRPLGTGWLNARQPGLHPPGRRRRLPPAGRRSGRGGVALEMDRGRRHAAPTRPSGTSGCDVIDAVRTPRRPARAPARSPSSTAAERRADAIRPGLAGTFGAAASRTTPGSTATSSGPPSGCRPRSCVRHDRRRISATRSRATRPGDRGTSRSPPCTEGDHTLRWVSRPPRNPVPVSFQRQIWREK